MKNIELNPDFITALALMENKEDNIFLTGKAGTGKSTLLTYFRMTTKKKVVVLAPTGIAALNVKGETIHSFFKFKPNVTVEIAERKAKGWKSNRIFKTLDAIIIDEISMVRADLLDCIDIFLQTVLDNKFPFGGKQLIMIGDLHQLPPVVTPTEKRYFQEVYDSPYFFSANVCNNPDFYMQHIELSKIYRQEDEVFINILNNIRENTATKEHLHHLNTKSSNTNTPAKSGHIYLTTTNANADRINTQKLSAITQPDFEFSAEISKKFDKKMAPTEEHLVLKNSAQVMFLNNDANGQWVNGTIGEIVDINEFEEEITVKTGEHKSVIVTPHKWNMSKYIYDESTKQLSQESAGSFRQFPLKLAWAITIHKSQGKTFDSVVIDLGNGTFASGQTYVALSRCRSLEGLTLKAPLKSYDIKLDTRIKKWQQTLQKSIT